MPKPKDLIRVPLIYWPQKVYVRSEELDFALAGKRNQVPLYTRDGRRRALLANPKPFSSSVHVSNISLPITDWSRETIEKNYANAK